MTPGEAADLAARTLAAIDAQPWPDRYGHHWTADRERVASDFAGLRECHNRSRLGVRFADNLRRTAALYGVTP